MARFDISGIANRILRINNGVQYTSVVLALATARQPNAARPVHVVASLSITSDDADAGVIIVETSPDNGVYTQRAHTANGFDVSGVVGVTGTSTIVTPVSFIVPQGHWYRITGVPFGGTPTFAISQISELVL